MSFAQTALLGGIAGFTIYIGLPLGRLTGLSTLGRVCLAMFAVGILAFIFVDVLQSALAIVSHSVEAWRRGSGGAATAIGRVALLSGGFIGGSVGIATVERRLRPLGSPQIAGGATAAVAVGELGSAAEHLRREAALHRGLTVAGAIGLHNFAEGLAIGVAARSGAISLATVLIIGFALHNATEGFGIVGPLGDVQPSWRWLGLAGLIGGGPTFIGTLAGYAVTSLSLELVFYALAGGAILYVIGEVWHGMRRYGHREAGLLMLSCGFIVGVITDMVVAYGGL